MNLLKLQNKAQNFIGGWATFNPSTWSLLRAARLTVHCGMSLCDNLKKICILWRNAVTKISGTNETFNFGNVVTLLLRSMLTCDVKVESRELSRKVRQLVMNSFCSIASWCVNNCLVSYLMYCHVFMHMFPLHLSLLWNVSLVHQFTAVDLSWAS